eukprot:SM000398S15215  [mRNA]  locus=s398:19300:20975:- [translate_table: standard]
MYEVQAKRPRRDYDDLPPMREHGYGPPGASDHGGPSYVPAAIYDERGGLSSSYARELPPYDMGVPGMGQRPQYNAGVAPSFAQYEEPLMAAARGGLDPALAFAVQGHLGNGRPAAAYEPERPAVSLPHDAAPTLFIDGLPPDCSRREAAHIFRPFIGYKEVRLVLKDARRGGVGDKIALCFVEFEDAACASTALEALQGKFQKSAGYRFDEEDPRSPVLRLTFARKPGPRGPPPRELGAGGFRPGPYDRQIGDFERQRSPLGR